MSNIIKFTIIFGVFGCYVWYLNSLQARIGVELSQLTNIYAHSVEIAAQSSR